jgi:hypothetical protein
MKLNYELTRSGESIRSSRPFLRSEESGERVPTSGVHALCLSILKIQVILTNYDLYFSFDRYTFKENENYNYKVIVFAGQKSQMY